MDRELAQATDMAALISAQRRKRKVRKHKKHKKHKKARI